jgi:hypothetical protein
MRMAKKRKRIDPARIRALNGGDEAYERHERVQRQLAELSARFQRRIDEARRLHEAEQAS